MKTLRWGIIGPGKIATDFALDTSILESPQEITAILGHSEETATEFAKRFSVPEIYYDLQEMLTKAKLDAVYIASPHTQHFDQAKACLQKGIPVLCEKPMTINTAQCRELTELSAAKKVFLMEGMWIQFLPSIQLVTDLVRDNRIGKLISVKAAIGYRAPYDRESRYFDPEDGGGALLDLGIYPVFLSNLLLGIPEAIKAFVIKAPTGIDAASAVMMKYKDGAYAMLESSLNTQTDSAAEIAGDKGYIRINHPWFEKSPSVELVDSEGVKTIYPLKWKGHGLHFEIKEVIECIEKKKTQSELFSHSTSLQLAATLDRIKAEINVHY